MEQVGKFFGNFKDKLQRDSRPKRPKQPKYGVSNRRQPNYDPGRLIEYNGPSELPSPNAPKTRWYSHDRTPQLPPPHSTLELPAFQAFDSNFSSLDHQPSDSTNPPPNYIQSEQGRQDDNVHISGPRSSGQGILVQQDEQIGKVVAPSVSPGKRRDLRSEARSEQDNPQDYGLPDGRGRYQRTPPRSLVTVEPSLSPHREGQGLSRDRKASGAEVSEAGQKHYNKERRLRALVRSSSTIQDRNKVPRSTRDRENGSRSSGAVRPGSSQSNPNPPQYPLQTRTPENYVHRGQSSEDNLRSRLDNLRKSVETPQRKVEERSDYPQGIEISTSAYRSFDIVRKLLEPPPKNEEEQGGVRDLWCQSDSKMDLDELQQARNTPLPMETMDENLDQEIPEGRGLSEISRKHPDPQVQESFENIGQSSSPREVNEDQANTSRNLDLVSKEESISEAWKALLNVFGMVREVTPKSISTSLDEKRDGEITPEHVEKIVADFVGAFQQNVSELTDMKGRLEEDRKEWDDKKEDLETKHGKAIQELKDEISRAEEKHTMAEEKNIADNMRTHRHYGDQISGLQADISQLKVEKEDSKKNQKEQEENLHRAGKACEEMRHTQTRLKGQIAQLLTDNKQLVEKQGALQEKHRVQEEGLREELQNQMARGLQQLRDQNARQLQELQTKHQNWTGQLLGEISKLEDAHAAQIRDLEIKHDDATRVMRAERERKNLEHELEIKSIQDGFSTERQEHADTLRMTEDGHASQMYALKQEHHQELNRLKAQISSMQSKYEAETKEKLKKLTAEKERFKTALIRREHLKGMADSELESNFRDLADQVEQSARVEWNRNMEGTWPFPQTAFWGKRSEITLKRHVIQSMIWVMLYDRIFCTPFRILGDEGKSLDSTWTESFPQDRGNKERGWPRPSEDSEKWRYEEVKKCRDAIDRAIPRIKESYERSLMAVANGLSAILGTVAPVDNKVLSNMNNLAEMAATLWLKIGTQRFRVVVVISDETKTSTQGGKGRAGQRDPQELVVQPGLRRIGNSHGENLNIEQFIPDCKGTFTNFQSG